MTGLIFVSGMLAAGAGIGGGGLYVPIFLMFGWGKLAVVRSLAATTGLALALLFLVMFQRHPEADRPAVDYRAMLVLEPIVLLGTLCSSAKRENFNQITFSCRHENIT